MKYSIIIPVYEESGNLELLRRKLTDVLRTLSGSYEIVFVDDGSKDRSFEDLKLMAKSDGSIKVLRFRRNFGKSAAMAAGFCESTGAIILNLDADLQDDPAEIPRMLSKLDEGYDLVVGWRRTRHDPVDKRLPSKIFNLVVSKWSGVPLHDFNCGFKVYKREVLAELPLYSDMHRFLPVLAAKRGFRVTELSIEHHPRHAGRSKYGVGRTLRGLLDFISVLFLTAYLARPMHFFGTFGVISILSSFITGVWAVGLKIAGTNFVNTPLPLLTVFLLLLGLQFILLGLLAEMLTRTYFESSGKPTYHIAERVNF
ncbi:MAG: Glycosyl transferase family 2 [Parcubacteria group bacterium GW2011_GWA2_51_10]|nr:MAG: Glycosyl transferase family 2 [Parcubacteria group bacterium GW2011_GWA2_51_10]